jgi:hypothetical protein
MKEVEKRKEGQMRVLTDVELKQVAGGAIQQGSGRNPSGKKVAVHSNNPND